MIRPELAGRIRDTCTQGLKDWHEMDLKAIGKIRDPQCKQWVAEEVEYIESVLKGRKPVSV